MWRNVAPPVGGAIGPPRLTMRQADFNKNLCRRWVVPPKIAECRKVSNPGAAQARRRPLAHNDEVASVLSMFSIDSIVAEN